MTKEEILKRFCGHAMLHSAMGTKMIEAMEEYATQEKQGWVKIDEDYKMLPLRSVVGLRASGEALLTTSLHLTDQTYQFVYYVELPQKPEV